MNADEAFSQVSAYAGIAFDSARERAFSVLGGIEYDYARPSVLYRPKLSLDGNQWCALYGDDLQVGCAGFGDSPAEAMAAFDAEWNKKISK